jgi:hypothetical protein
MTHTAGPQARKPLILKLAAILLPVLFFAYVFGIDMKFNLEDPDLWWHLKTGEYTLQHWEVPEEDPFTYTTPKPLDEPKKRGLRAHWLGQVIFYLPYSIAGFNGVGVMRNILIVLPMALLFVLLLRRGLGVLTALVVISLPALMLSSKLYYAFERPQGFSFTLALVLVALLVRLKEQTGREGKGSFDFSFWLIPLVMAVWSNVHAGFIVGGVTIIVFMAAEGLRSGYHLLRGSREKSVRLAFFLVCLAAIGASFLNPNTYHIFYNYVSGKAMMFLGKVFSASRPGRGGGWVGQVVLEYRPLVYFYKNLGFTWLVFYWVFTGVMYLALLAKYWIRRRFDVTEFMVVSFYVFFANYYARGLMFSLTVLPFFLGKSLIEIKLPEVKYRIWQKGLAVALLAVTLSFFLHSYKMSPYIFKPESTKRWTSPWYPQGLVTFMKATKIGKPIYNYYTWGGFLIWSLYPDYQVFVDGRALDNKVTVNADAILKTHPGWQSLLDHYNINTIIIPVVYRESGHIIPLATTLVHDDLWKLVYLGFNSALFVRDVPRNSDIIERYSIDKMKIYKEIIRNENVFLSLMPWHPAYNIAKADALFALGMTEEAMAIYRRFPREAADRLRFMGR